MLRFVLATLGALLGASAGVAVGVVAPVVVFSTFSLGQTGSYEEFLVPWFLSIPAGFAVGGTSGLTAGLAITAAWTRWRG